MFVTVDFQEIVEVMQIFLRVQENHPQVADEMKAKIDTLVEANEAFVVWSDKDVINAVPSPKLVALLEDYMEFA